MVTCPRFFFFVLYPKLSLSLGLRMCCTLSLESSSLLSLSCLSLPLDRTQALSGEKACCRSSRQPPPPRAVQAPLARVSQVFTCLLLLGHLHVDCAGLRGGLVRGKGTHTCPTAGGFLVWRMEAGSHGTSVTQIRVVCESLFPSGSQAILLWVTMDYRQEALRGMATSGFNHRDRKTCEQS